MKIDIRPLEQNDFPHWLPLWNENNMGIKNEPVTTNTWGRLLDENQQVYGLCAVSKGEIAAIMHYVLHPTTGHTDPVCYMQDLYVDEKYRRKGIAKKLVQFLTVLGTQQKWARIYWLADGNNEGAQKLYQNLGIKLNFTLHVMPLE